MMKVIRLTVQDKEKLFRLKGRTEILNWNVLCRWALCCSLKEPSVPLDLPLGELLGVQKGFIYFTSGSTESNNLAILGMKEYEEKNQWMKE